MEANSINLEFKYYQDVEHSKIMKMLDLIEVPHLMED